jgi:hypothetical protein
LEQTGGTLAAADDRFHIVSFSIIPTPEDSENRMRIVPAMIMGSGFLLVPE